MDEPTGKRCAQCGETKPLDDFTRDRSRPDDRDPRCRPCNAERVRRWKAANPERARKIASRSRQVNAESARKARRRWKAANPEKVREATRRWNGAHREVIRENAQRQHAANRKAVFDHYGRVCACCGTTERLSIDHVNGDGREHRKQIGMGSSHLYRWLIANGFPAGFQVLCKPCNKSKADGDGCRIDHIWPRS